MTPDITQNKSTRKSITLFLLLFFLVTGSILHAQQVDSTKHTSADSLRLRAQQTISQVDSMKFKAQAKISHADSIKDGANGKQDSLRSIGSTVQQRLANFQQRISSRTDSIQGKRPPMNVNLDSLKPQTPGVVSDVQEKSLQVQDKIDNAQNKVGGKANGAVNVVNDKTSNVAQNVNEKTQQQIDKLGLDREGLSELGIKDTNLPGGKDLGVSSTAIPGVKLPDTAVPGVSGVDTTLPNAPGTELPSVPGANPLDGKGSSDGVKTPDLGEKLNVKEITDAQDGLQEVGENITEIQEQVAEVKEIKDTGLQDPDKLAEQAENRIENISQVQGATKSLSEVEEKRRAYEAMVTKYKDKKMVMADMKRKMANVVTDQVNQYTPQVMEAQDAMMKQKRILAKTGKVKGTVKKKENILGAKPFGERVIPGLTLQTMRGEDFVVDFGLQAGYRLTERLMAGVGVTYAVGFNKSYDLYARGLNTFGGRVYGDFLIMNGFFAHGEFALGQFRNYPASPEEPAVNTCGINTGIGKRFNLSKRLKGSMVALYRFEIKGESPQQSKINVRFGFDLYPSRKKKV